MNDATGDAASDDAGGYTIRPFEPGDVDGFLALYSEVFDGDPGREWFAWKYGDNPYADDVPAIVAERDGELVGARPFFALPMYVAGRQRRALQPADAMVHPDHRRRGLFTRMTEAAIERFRGDAAFFFNFPNPNSLPGNRKLGWEVVQDLPTYYRVRDPGALLPADGPAGALAPLLSRGARGYLRLRGLRAPDPPREVTVERHGEVPAGRLAALYRERRPAGLHAVREETFYRWRFGDAPEEYVTYLARRGGDPRAALVVADGTHGVAPVSQIVEAVPLALGDREGAVAALLRAVLGDRDPAAVLAPAGPLPDGVMAAFGFLRRGGVLSRFTSPTVHVARTLDDPPSQAVDGVDLLDADNWRLSFAELDNR